MNQLENILDEYRKFSEYLRGLDISALPDNFTRQQLNEFTGGLRKINLRSISYEVSKLTDQMKNDEFPELLGVHHFPVLRNIDFLSEEEKKSLDDHLLKFRKGNYVSGLTRIAKQYRRELERELETFLKDNGVVEEKYFALCPHCMDGLMSKILDKSGKDELDRILKDDDEDRYDRLQNILEYSCMECHNEVEYEELRSMEYRTVLQMQIERDQTLDNV